MSDSDLKGQMIWNRIVVGIRDQALSERTPDESRTHTGESQNINEAMEDRTQAEANPEAIGGHNIHSSSPETKPQGKLSNGAEVTALQESSSPNARHQVHRAVEERIIK